MNFVRTRLSLGNFIGSDRSLKHGATEGCAVNQRWSKQSLLQPQQSQLQQPQQSQHQHQVPGYKPSNMDKKFLLWSGRFKTEDQIPEIVSFEMLDAARNKARVKACYAMMAVTIGACLITAAGRNESLTVQNMEKKARWREEMQREKEAALALTEKAQ
ncbi:hypothetical protein F7725_029114 [Dissostichus mawsoni]|uniref:Protein FAM162B n=1 Tax=Dissostichus mawsoni TaxID=36200 RepID=A0A7J5XHI2_DISMA|nr:hypothetical protein F7725_029114 [Dissostichus mawsoni]